MNTHTKQIPCILSVLLLVLSFYPSYSNALFYHYSYKGSNFSDINGTNYTEANYVTIDILSDHQLTYTQDWHDSENQAYDVQSFSMSDGYQTRTVADSDAMLALYYGLSDGLPMAWWIWLEQLLPDGTRNHVFSTDSPDGVTDNAAFGGDSGYAFGHGEWSLSIEPEPIPEPSTAILLVTGLMGFLACRRTLQKEGSTGETRKSC